MAIQQYEILKVKTGYLGLGWCGDKITCLRLPEKTADDAVKAVKRRQPSAQQGSIPESLASVKDRIVRYFEGEAVEFGDVPVDLGSQDAFFKDIYFHLRTLTYGQTSTYGAIAKLLGRGPEAARDVGVAMATNPVPLIVPCHRVCAAGGKIGGFSAPGGSSTKAAMLELEGVQMTPPTPPAVQLQQAFSF